MTNAQEWRTTSLGSVATLQRGFDLPARKRTNGEIPIVSSSGTSGWHDRAMVTAPGVVTGRYGTIGQVFFLGRDFWPLNTTLWVSSFHGNDPLFVYYLLQRVDFATHSGKSGVPGVNRNDLHSEEVRVPSSPAEQHRIAVALSDTDDLIEKLGQLISKKRAIKQGMMQELLTSRADPVCISSVATRIGSGLTPRGGSTVYHATGRPFVRSQNVGWGTLRLNDLVFIDEATHDRFRASQIRAGDVLLNITGASIGRTAVATQRLEGGNVNQHVCEIRLDRRKMDPLFVNAVLLSRIGQDQIDSFQAGGNRQGLNYQQVGAIQIPCPPLAEQQRIGAALADASSSIASLERRITKTRAIKHGMMQLLLTGRTRLPVEETAA